jgi:hypothetical protein
MTTLETFATINASLDFQMRGKTPAGLRMDVHFAGTATSDRWEGEWPVSGIDYVTVRKSGTAELIIRATMGEGDDIVTYTASGLQSADGIVETLQFQTGSEKFAYLNDAVAVATGSTEGKKLTLTVSLVKP